jgi:hypothetical protein
VKYVLQENSGARGARSLLTIYEQTPCSFCRYYAVDMLKGAKQVPNWMREECRWDADPRTRKVLEPPSEAFTA